MPIWNVHMEYFLQHLSVDMSPMGYEMQNGYAMNITTSEIQSKNIPKHTHLT